LAQRLKDLRGVIKDTRHLLREGKIIHFMRRGGGGRSVWVHGPFLTRFRAKWGRRFSRLTGDIRVGFNRGYMVGYQRAIDDAQRAWTA
jgi:hypothetical protein